MFVEKASFLAKVVGVRQLTNCHKIIQLRGKRIRDFNNSAVLFSHFSFYCLHDFNYSDSRLFSVPSMYTQAITSVYFS